MVEAAVSREWLSHPPLLWFSFVISPYCTYGASTVETVVQCKVVRLYRMSDYPTTTQ